MGFGMTTVLPNLHNAGFFGLDDLILAMGIFYGGLAQVIAGTMEFRKGNTFGVTAFTSYGLFWLTLAYILLAGNTELITVGSSSVFLGWYLFAWGVFTAAMFVGTLYKNRALQVVFGSLAVLFFLLAFGHWFDSELLINIAGFEGIFCGLSAVYLALAEVLNDSAGRTLFPVGSRVMSTRPVPAIPLSAMPPLDPTVEHPLEGRVSD